MDPEVEYNVSIEPSLRRNRSDIQQDSGLQQESREFKFPLVEIKSSNSKFLNEKVMRCAVECFSKYKVSANDLAGVMVDTSNIVYNQKWEKGDLDQDGESESSSDDESEDVQHSTSSKRRKTKKKKANRFKFPSRRSLNFK